MNYGTMIDSNIMKKYLDYFAKLDIQLEIIWSNSWTKNIGIYVKDFGKYKLNIPLVCGPYPSPVL